MEGTKRLSDTKWLEECEGLLLGPIRVLKFLNLVELDSSLHWKPKRRLIYLAKKPSKIGAYGPLRTENDTFLIDMLTGIANGVVFDDDGMDVKNTYYHVVKIIATCIGSMLGRLNLLQFKDYGLGPVWKPTPLLRKLFNERGVELERTNRLLVEGGSGSRNPINSEWSKV